MADGFEHLADNNSTPFGSGKLWFSIVVPTLKKSFIFF